ncbi:MAG: RNA methyltransferase [Brumimicrobium sp.]|nr:RNA methyltransferase [Brumimicrobium sp.]
MNRKLKLWELNRPSVEEFKEKKKFPVVLILDNIRSLSNIGAFFRTADAFNVKKIYLCGITASPPHREIQKTALGATESVEWKHVEDVVILIQELKKKKVKICSIEQAEKTIMLNEFEINQSSEYALVFGNEVDGVNQRVIDESDYILEVPQFGTKHSLNVSVCAGVVLWEFVRAF